MKNTTTNLKATTYEEREYHHYLPLEVYPEFYFETHDIGVAAALMCCGLESPTTLTKSSGESSFIFAFSYEVNSLDRAYGHPDAKETPEELVERYTADTLKVNAKSFFEHLSGLESELRLQYGK